MEIKLIDYYGISLLILTALMEVFDVFRSYLSHGSNYSVYNNYGELFIETLLAVLLLLYLIIKLFDFVISKYEQHLEKRKEVTV